MSIGLVTITLVIFAFAGEIHEGYSSSKPQAVENANKAARDAARDKKTCWEPAKMSECKKDADGYWTCYAESANHQGSCGDGSGKRKP